MTSQLRHTRRRHQGGHLEETVRARQCWRDVKILITKVASHGLLMISQHGVTNSSLDKDAKGLERGGSTEETEAVLGGTNRTAHDINNSIELQTVCARISDD